MKRCIFCPRTVCLHVCMRFSVCALTSRQTLYVYAALGLLPVPHCLNLKCSLNLLNINLCGMHLCTQCMQWRYFQDRLPSTPRGSLSLLCAVSWMHIRVAVCIGIDSVSFNFASSNSFERQKVLFELCHLDIFLVTVFWIKHNGYRNSL